MSYPRDDAVSILSTLGPDGPLEAAVVFKRTGATIAGWTRDPVPQDIVTVMAATLLGSVQTLVEALGDTSPASVLLETELRRILVAKVDPQVALLLVAPKSVSESTLRQIARRVVRREKPRSSNGAAAPSSVVVKT